MNIKKRIVVTQDMYFSQEDLDRLSALGDVTYYDTFANTDGEWLDRIKDADIILSGKKGLRNKIHELKDVFISVPFVGVGWMDTEILSKSNVKVSSAPGCNSHAVSEWIVGMTINLVRNFNSLINITDSPYSDDKTTLGLNGRNVTILGAGHIGRKVGKILKALDMNVSFFKRGDVLTESTKNALVVINVLSSNSSTDNLLDADFFAKMKKGSYFITVTSRKIYDIDALITELDNSHLAGVASDAGSVMPNDSLDPYYLRLQKHPKIIATPHIAARTEAADQIGNGIMVDNVEFWLKGEPINLIS